MRTGIDKKVYKSLYYMSLGHFGDAPDGDGVRPESDITKHYSTLVQSLRKYIVKNLYDSFISS